MTLTLCDTGPVLAIVDTAQASQHARCVRQLNALRGKLVTTWPCVTEMMHLAAKIGGRPMQRAVWKLLHTRYFEIETLTKADGERMNELMERYANVPMDLADGSLFVTAERRGTRRIFTLDKDFRIYRFDDGGTFEVVPS